MPARRLPCAVLCLVLLAACVEAPPEATQEPGGDAAFALLARLGGGTPGAGPGGAVAEAYRRLDGYAYTAEVTLTTHGEGTRTATRTVTRRPVGDGVEERLVSATGDDGLGEDWAERLRLQNPLVSLLPDEPAFLGPRAHEDYRYTLNPDTSLGGAHLRVVEAALRAEAGRDQAVRRARYFLLPEADDVRGVEVLRRSTSVLYDETAWARVFLQPGPGGALVPAEAVVETTVDVPGAAPRRLRIEQRFRDVRAD